MGITYIRFWDQRKMDKGLEKKFHAAEWNRNSLDENLNNLSLDLSADIALQIEGDIKMKKSKGLKDYRFLFLFSTSSHCFRMDVKQLQVIYKDVLSSYFSISSCSARRHTYCYHMIPGSFGCNQLTGQWGSGRWCVFRCQSSDWLGIIVAQIDRKCVVSVML